MTPQKPSPTTVKIVEALEYCGQQAEEIGKSDARQNIPSRAGTLADWAMRECFPELREFVAKLMQQRYTTGYVAGKAQP